MLVTDRQLLDQIQYHLVEAPDEGATVPSGLWTATEFLDELNGAQRSFVRRTRAFVGFAQPIMLAANTESLDLTGVAGFEDVFQIIEVVLQIGSDYYEIPPSSTFAGDHATPNWSTTAGATTVPRGYTVTDTPTHTLRFLPASDVGGTVHIAYIPRPWELDRVGSGSGENLMVPGECALGVKWATLNMLLSKPGRAHDAARAAYCQRRAEEIEELTERLVDGL